jgi:hypothetical protein
MMDDIDIIALYDAVCLLIKDGLERNKYRKDEYILRKAMLDEMTERLVNLKQSYKKDK